MNEARWRSELLGTGHTLSVTDGAIDYWERGDGPALVFSHGWLSNANLWRAVVDILSDGCRCLVLDLPLGSHRMPMAADADLSPAGIGAVISEFVEALDLQDVTLVGNDSGGAYSQIALAVNPALAKRVARLILTSCETPDDEWPPPPFDTLTTLARDPRALGELLDALRDPATRLLPAAYGLLHKHPIPPAVSDSYALPATTDSRVLHDVAKAIASASTEQVRAAGANLVERSDLPVLLVWSNDDTVFPVAHARHFASQLHDSRIEIVDDCYSFVPEDQPVALASAIARFVGDG